MNHTVPQSGSDWKMKLLNRNVQLRINLNMTCRMESMHLLHTSSTHRLIWLLKLFGLTQILMISIHISYASRNSSTFRGKCFFVFFLRVR